MSRTEMQKMLAGELYCANDAELQSDLAITQGWLARFNATLGQNAEARRVVLAERLGAVERDVDVRPPFHCDYGFNIRLGEGVFLNFNCVILDVVEVSIGDRTQIGPGVQILCADHPREAEARRAGLKLGRPIAIGSDVWVGAGALILPGVRIGDGATVGAGSVVTRNVSAGARAFGNPARTRTR